MRLAIIGALLRRELRASLPWFVFLIVGEIVHIALLSANGAAEVLESNESARWFSWAFGVVVGVSIGGRDARTGATAFLDTLPVSRSALFGARVVVGAAAIVIGDVGGVISAMVADTHHLDAALGAPSGAPLVDVVRVVSATVVIDLSGFALGVLCAPLGAGAGFFVVVGLLATAWASVNPRWLAATPGGGGEFVYVAGRVVVGAEARAVWALVGVVCVLVALLGVRRQQFTATRRPRPRLRRAAIVVGFVASVAAVWAAAPAGDGPKETLTRHVRLTHLPTATIAVGALKPSIDDDLDDVERFFGRGFGRRLHVDATQRLFAKHGVANGAALAIDRVSGLNRFVITHEATHAMAGLVSDGAISRVNVFSEGLANFVARRITDEAVHDDPAAWLARLDRDKRLDDSVLVDEDALKAIGDELLVYAVGEELVRAMVDVYGEDAPLRVVRALGEVAAAGVDNDADLFRLALYRSGMVLSPIAGRFFARVRAVDPGAAADAKAPFVAVDVVGGHLVISGLAADGTVVDGVTCRSRDRAQIGQPVPGCSVDVAERAGLAVEVQVERDGVASSWIGVPLDRGPP